MSDAAFTHDVFLSHNQADKPRVRRLAERLRAANFNFALPKAVLFRDPAIADRCFVPLLRAAEFTPTRFVIRS